MPPRKYNHICQNPTCRQPFTTNRPDSKFHNLQCSREGSTTPWKKHDPRFGKVRLTGYDMKGLEKTNG